MHAFLSSLDDVELDALLATGKLLGAGHCSVLDVEGTRVFVKRVPLTDLEVANPLSTANLFDLPPFFHYGIGSAGVNAWRELAAHTMTTSSVHVPELYHWRVRPGTAPIPAEHQDLEASVEYWGGSAAARARFEACRTTTANLVLFLEHVPHTLHDWLNARLTEGPEAVEQATAMVDRELREITTFLAAQDLLHFDAHFANILTDGSRLYVSDFGLALSTHFDLTPAEREFFEHHRTYDRCYTVTHLLMSLSRVDDPLSPATRAVVERHQPVADLMGAFYRDLEQRSRTTPYPAAELARVLA